MWTAVAFEAQFYRNLCRLLTIRRMVQAQVAFELLLGIEFSLLCY